MMSFAIMPDTLADADQIDVVARIALHRSFAKPKFHALQGFAFDAFKYYFCHTLPLH
jgi:hypothetical protein